MYQLLIENKGTIYDATDILVEEVKWFSSIFGEAGRLEFAVYKDGLIDFVEGNAVHFLVGGEKVFSGWVMTKTRTSQQIISVVAYDQIFYWAKNKETYIYTGKTASDIVNFFCGKYGFATGSIDNTGWVIPSRIEEGQSLLDMVFSALEITKNSNGKEFLFFDKAGKLFLQEKSKFILPVVLKNDGGIQDYWYETDISTNTYNAIKIYQGASQFGEELVCQKEDSELIKDWGRLQKYEHMTFGLNKAQIENYASEFIENNGKVSKKIKITAVNNDQLFFAGNSFYLEIPDLAEISVAREVLIERCTHSFKMGEHTVVLEVDLSS